MHARRALGTAELAGRDGPVNGPDCRTVTADCQRLLEQRGPSMEFAPKREVRFKVKRNLKPNVTFREDRLKNTEVFLRDVLWVFDHWNIAHFPRHENLQKHLSEHSVFFKRSSRKVTFGLTLFHRCASPAKQL